jgi:predicted GH43/DUF377 family glycosyl hydrolase
VSARRVPCVYFGKPTGVHTPHSGIPLPLHACTRHGSCTPLPAGDVKSCQDCNDYTVPGSPALLNIAPLRVVRVALEAGADLGHWNCSMIDHGGRLIMATRKKWKGADLWLHELDGNYRPTHSRKLDVRHHRCRSGREDPRLFTFRNRLHLAFSGLQAHAGELYVHLALAKLAGNYGVEEVWIPEYDHRSSWEKNWQCFEHDGRLYAVYAIHPHTVLELRGTAAVKVASEDAAMPWAWGEKRGGCPPVRVGNEFYHFFHGRRRDSYETVYSLGLYTFDARPPFRPRRYCPGALLLPDAADKRPGARVNVVYPAGAVLRGDRWAVAYGYQDRECRVVEFSGEAIERALAPVPSASPPATLAGASRVVYTALFGRRDRLRPISVPPGWAAACFTDDPAAVPAGWTAVFVPRAAGLTPRRAARHVKTMPQLYLRPEVGLSLWLDANIDLACDPSDLAATYLTDADVATVRHHVRDCVYAEAASVILHDEAPRAMVEAQVARYREAGHPERAGLYATGVLLRRHAPAALDLGAAWWREIELGSDRDQISLPVVARRLGTKVVTMEVHDEHSRRFPLRPHAGPAED